MASRGGPTCTIALAALLACSPDPGPEEPVPGDAVVARIGDQAIGAAELDGPLRMRLFDLEWAAYELRRARLEQLVAGRLADSGASDADRVSAAVAAGEVELLLQPPARPRIPLPVTGAPARGAQDAPVSLLVFCDFESIHCARIQPILRRLLDELPGLVRQAHRDAPLPFHRHARRAAEAARCAEAQGGFWRFHDALYALRQEGGLPLERVVERAGVDAAELSRCLAAGEGRAAVEADLALAREYGIATVPVSFVNGLYLKGPASERAFRALIEAELAAAGVALPSAPEAPAERPPRISQLPLELVGTLVSEDPEESLAVLESERWGETRLFRPGEEVLADATLSRIEARRVLLRRGDGSLELLTLRPRGEVGLPAPELVREAVPEASGVLRLSRAEVEAALADRPALERQLSPGRLDLEGKRLLKLGPLEPDGFYASLGLEEGDVIMQVDGEFVHDQYNPLWEALRSRSRIGVTIMRRGLPRSFELAIE